MKNIVLAILALNIVILGSDNSKQKPPSREFYSENKEYNVIVDYEKWGGAGNAQYTVKNKNNETISAFSTNVAPRIVRISNTGERIIAFGGNWNDVEFINKICFYDKNGKEFKRYSVEILAISGMGISSNGKYFILGYELGSKGQLALFNVITGDKLWDIPMAFRPDEVAITGNGEWIVAIGNIKDHWVNKNYVSSEKEIVLLDIKGEIKYSDIKELHNGGHLLIAKINEEGTEFNIMERESIRIETSDVHRPEFDRRIKRIYNYKKIDGKIKLNAFLDTNIVIK